MATSSKPRNEELVRCMVRIFARASALQGGLEGRRLALLRGLADWLEIEGWTFRNSDGVESRDGSVFRARNAVLTWNSPNFDWIGVRSGNRPFSESERWAVDLIFRNASWLSGIEKMQGTADSTHPFKSLRLVQVMAGLTQGESRKEIAHRLGISINTVAGYVKEIYRIHGVNSQAMLINHLETRACQK